MIETLYSPNRYSSFTDSYYTYTFHKFKNQREVGVRFHEVKNLADMYRLCFVSESNFLDSFYTLSVFTKIKIIKCLVTI